MNFLLAHRNASMAHALTLMLEEHDDIEVVGTVTKARGILPLAAETKPHLVLVDPLLPELDLEGLVSGLDQSTPSTGVVVIDGTNDPAHLQDAVESGARAYVSMDGEPEWVIRSLCSAAEGRVVIAGPGTGSLADMLDVDASGSTRERGPAGRLTDREIEVVNLVTEGATNDEIAETLIVTQNTVKVHLRNIFRKMEVRNRQQLTAHAIRSGLVQDAELVS